MGVVSAQTVVLFFTVCGEVPGFVFLTPPVHLLLFHLGKLFKFRNHNSDKPGLYVNSMWSQNRVDLTGLFKITPIMNGIMQKRATVFHIDTVKLCQPSVCMTHTYNVSSHTCNIQNVYDYRTIIAKNQTGFDTYSNCIIRKI